jgi:glutamate carboxypeptidase
LPEVHTRGGSDGSLVAALGVATLDGLGPVSLDDCSSQEKVVINTLVPRTLLLANLIVALAREYKEGRPLRKPYRKEDYYGGLLK